LDAHWPCGLATTTTRGVISLVICGHGVFANRRHYLVTMPAVRQKLGLSKIMNFGFQARCGVFSYQLMKRGIHDEYIGLFS
jgi:hypothetical protein